MARVIFLQNIKGVALVGDVKNVADGYARNFLLPRKLAVLATPQTLKQAEVLKQKRALAIEQEKEAAKIMAEKLKDFVLNIERVANEEGTLYDGVDGAEISRYLKKAGFNLEPESVLLKEPIKKVGEHETEIELDKDLKAALKITITKQAE